MHAKRLFDALSFAAEKHRHQRRKDADATPYINHPIAVAAVLADADVTDEDTLIAAVLHDTIEDTQTSFDELAARFGRAVALLVAEVTDDKSLPKAERKRLQIEHAAESSARAKQIKIADKTCNVRDVASAPPPDWPASRRREYLSWAEQVVARCRGVNAGLDLAFDRALASAREALLTGPTT